MPVSLVYVTAASEQEALTIAKVTVEEGLVACANVLPRMTSVYRWKEQLYVEQEALLLLKIESSRCDEVVARVRDLHSYDLPCVVVYESSGGNPEYLRWVEQQSPPEPGNEPSF